MSEGRVSVGVVVIGRNEGARLRRCLESLRGWACVYVDSGSTDGSVNVGREMGAEVVELDMGRPFTAARARNEGFARLRQKYGDLLYVQFVDGDCEMISGWIEAAAAHLTQHEGCAAVAGRLRERHPERSWYNRLCDMEWNVEPGEARACGGVAMYRARALAEVSGFDGSMIAGEEPELCLRLRERGWGIWQMREEMALHDAAMMKFGQWWKRAVRGGYAYALGAGMHGSSRERHYVRETRSIWLWACAVPTTVLALAWWTWGWSLMLLLGYVVLGWRVWRHMRRRGFSSADARLYAGFCILGKFAGAVGMGRYWVGKAASRPARIMEYKQAGAAVQG